MGEYLFKGEAIHGVEMNYLKLHAVDREVFRVLLGLLPPATLPKGKAGTKMSE